MEPNVDPLFARKILVAEDDYFAAFDLADFLERAGADVIGPVSNVVDAIDLVRKSVQLDWAILDVTLQDGRCFSLANALQWKGKPFLFVTGYDRGELEARYPGVPVLEKPIDYMALLATLTGFER
ncbi:response regulator (plasmid) [Rhizobium indicum]|uniref:response regulator n=1 Tax=Rhizobium indicum TaxID=2583231 RepID=UPI0011075234|nr:response regulator [Rhizobium indicum]QKK33323.1 response regulator [Rhizobium indicum]